MWAFVILAVIFLILWLVEKQKTKSYENLKAAKAAADAYVNQKKSEGDSLYEAKHREALDYYWKKTQSADKKGGARSCKACRRKGEPAKGIENTGAG